MQQSLSKNSKHDINDTSAKLLQTVQELLAEIRPGETVSQRITLDSALVRDLGLDSLARVELLSRIEQRFMVSLPERVFAEAETPRDLLRAVLSAHTSGTSFELPSSEISLGESEAVPQSVQTLIKLLHWHVLAHPDRPHIRIYNDEGKDEIITYQQLWLGAERIAAGLQKRDLQAGETVAIMLPTSKAYFFSFFGILLAGGIPVPIYPPVRRTQIEEHLRRHGSILSNCLAIMLITVPEAKRVARLLKTQVSALRGVITAEELLNSAGKLTIPVRGPQDIAFLQYTSGSTGNPKGVVLTHANLLANIRAMGAVVQADSSDVFVSWLPLYHDMGLIGAWLGSLYYAALFVVMSPLAFLARPQRWFWAIHRYGGTLSAAPNFGYELCLRRLSDDDIKGVNLASWRVAFNGAEVVSPDTMLNFHQRFKHYGLRAEALMPVYGLAETAVGLAFPPLGRGILIDRIQREPFMRSGSAIACDASDTKALRFVASGQSLPGHEIRIVDATGHELPDRQEGQLQFRGPSVTSGYFRNPEETGRLYAGDWLNSGDLAYMAGGDVYITGRSKDVIIRAGRNIYPEELEEAIGNITGIRKGRVAAFASIDAASGAERLVVIAETREQVPERREQLRSQINSITTDLAEAAADKVVLAVPNTVLKTSSGKIRRAASRELYEAGKVGKQQKSFFWQLTRLALAGLGPQLRRIRQTTSAKFYGGYASLLFWVHAPVVWLLAALLPRVAWRWVAIRAGARLLAWTSATPLNVQGEERLPPAAQACVFVVNHASYLDGPVLVAAIKRQFSFVAKAELLGKFVPSVFLRRIQAEFVERFDQQKGVNDARRLVDVARQGRSLVFFPEGTFTRVSGLLPFHMGAFAAAAEARLPVVPVTIRGTRSILRSGTLLPHHSAITVIFGQAIYPENVKQKATDSDWTIAIKLRDLSREAILRHCGEPDLSRENLSI